MFSNNTVFQTIPQNPLTTLGLLWEYDGMSDSEYWTRIANLSRLNGHILHVAGYEENIGVNTQYKTKKVTMIDLSLANDIPSNTPKFTSVLGLPDQKRSPTIYPVSISHPGLAYFNKPGKELLRLGACIHFSEFTTVGGSIHWAMNFWSYLEGLSDLDQIEPWLTLVFYYQDMYTTTLGIVSVLKTAQEGRDTTYWFEQNLSGYHKQLRFLGNLV